MPARSSRMALGLALAALFLLAGCRPPAGLSPQHTSPPIATVVPDTLEMYGITWVDNYAWMKDVPRGNPQTIAYVEAENDYADAVMRPTRRLQKSLFEEMRARIQETDLEVPVRVDDYYYYSRTQEGQDYRIYCRRHGSLEAPEEITLDVNALAEGFEFYDVGDLEYSPDHRLLAFAADTTGAEKYTVRFKDLASGRLLSDALYPVRGVTWANDNQTVFYTREIDPDVESRFQLYRHRLGTGQEEDELLYEEPDLAFGLWVTKTRSKDYLVLYNGDNETTEISILRADDPFGEFRLLIPRQEGVEWGLEQWGDRFFYLTNADGATNFKVLEGPAGDPDRDDWEEFIAPRDSVYLTAFDVFRDHFVAHERVRGLERLRIIDPQSRASRYVEFPEPTYVIYSGRNPNYVTDTYRLTYMSLVTPRSVYDYDFASGELMLRKRVEVLGGFDPADYRSERLYAPARDGARVPISMVYRRDLFRRDGTNPLYLYGYGAYGLESPPYFSSVRLSLLNRGFVYAIAHIRGGDELGRSWHDQGRLLQKRNTFNDFIDSAEFLVAAGYTSPERLVANGGSAGGMMVAVVTNMRPDLFHTVVADVPAVNEFQHQLDPTLPGVEFHYTEWGNPNIREQFDDLRSWDAYMNVRPQIYPDMLVTAGLFDPRVPYWEPAMYVAKLRALKRGDNMLLLRTNMSGHGGASGRYDYLKEIAFEYAFILKSLGMTGRTGAFASF
jgi:oligopeptidase B